MTSQTQRKASPAQRSPIPLVDQICDVRDLVANSKKINDDNTNKWSSLALVLTLIGLFPTLGSLTKGCFKILFAYGRKSLFKAGHTAFETVWEISKPFVETGIKKLNEFFDRPEVRSTLSALHWDNPYQELSKLARQLAGQLTIQRLLAAFDEGLNALTRLASLIDRWGNAAMLTRTGDLIKNVKGVRDLRQPQAGGGTKASTRLVG